MAKHLLKFNNEAEYNAATINKPAVSWCVEENTVKYDPYVPPYVEIAGIKWAKMNVGAETETDYGLYFQWGDTSGYTADQVGSGEGKKPFKWTDYKYWTGDTGSGSSGMTKYNSTDGKTVLDLEDDAARANMGEGWRMPTSAEFQALGAAVNTAWTSNYNESGVAGMVCTDKTDSSKVLFFPAAGDCNVGRIYDVGAACRFFSSKLSSDKTLEYMIVLRSGSVNWQTTTSRCIGYPVRGVLDSAS